MRLLELYLKAYGGFTEARINLCPDEGSEDSGQAGSGAGLCVLYGANEAGKSTALRAIRGLIYGIPGQCPDNFVHAYRDLRIGGRARFDDGTDFAWMRRKRAKQSVYDFEDQRALSQTPLDALVTAVPEALFERFYGLDHPGLSRGSAALLEDDGAVGRALFGAGSGLAGLGAVLDQLESEAAELFAPRASKPRVNALIGTHGEIERALREIVLDPNQWATQEERVRTCAEKVARLAENIAKTRTQHSRVERSRRVLSPLRKRTEALALCDRLESVATLPADFGERVRVARESIVSAEETVERENRRIAREHEAAVASEPDPRLLEGRESIEALHRKIEAYERTVEALPRAEAELAKLDREMNDLLGGAASTGPEQIAPFRNAVERSGLVQTLGSEAVKIEERLAHAEALLRETERTHARLSEKAGRAPTQRIDAEALRRACGSGRRLGEIDRQIEEEEAALARLCHEEAQASARLGFEASAVDQIEATGFPAHVVIEEAGRTRKKTVEAVERALEEHAERSQELERTLAALAKLQGEGDVPTAEELQSLRAERDRAWRDLREQVIDGSAPNQSGIQSIARPLANRFETTLTAADEWADRLRSDARRVTEQASLQADRARLERAITQCDARTEEARQAQAAAEADWQALWEGTGVSPTTPYEKGIWRRDLDALLEEIGRRRVVERGLDAKRRKRSQAAGAIASALGAPGTQAEPVVLADLLEDAEERLARDQEIDQVRQRDAEALERAEEDRTRNRRDREEALARRVEWQVEWSAAMASMNRDADTRPEVAADYIQRSERVLERLRGRSDVEEQLERMQKDKSAFEASVSSGINAWAPEWAEESPSAAARRLHQALSEALENQVRVTSSREAMAAAEAERAEAQARAQAADAALAELRERAHAADESALDVVLLDWQRRIEAERELAAAEAELARSAEGVSIEELMQESEGAHPDALAAEAAGLQDKLDALELERDEANQALERERGELARMDGSAQAAELAERSQSTLASLRRESERYVQLRMAARLLREQIERYRVENQGPLLTRATAIFSALTRGRYQEVGADGSESGERARLQVREGQDQWASVGQLSAGTRDQLFLSLRLASLEQSLVAGGESMPLIADDILIEFDEERTRASLEVLAELAGENQILLFSHHRHVAEIASDLGPSVLVRDL